MNSTVNIHYLMVVRLSTPTFAKPNCRVALQALLLWILCPCVSFPLDTAELPVIQTTIIAHCCQPKGAVWQKSAGLPVVSGCRTYRKPNCAIKQSCVFCPATKSPLSQPRKLIALYKSKRPDQANGGYAIRILLNCSWSQSPASSYTYIYINSAFP